MANSSVDTIVRSDAYYKFLTLDQKTFMTVAEAEDLSRDLAAEILATGQCPDLVFGLANGALLPTKIVADTLGTPFKIGHVRRKGSRYKQILLDIKDRLRIPTRLIMIPPLMFLWRFLQERTSDLAQTGDAFDVDVRGQYVVVVDDAIQTGKSARYVKDQLIKQGATTVRIAVICWYKGIGDSGEWGPDIFLHRKDQYYPWSSNSIYLKEFYAWLPANGLKLWRE